MVRFSVAFGIRLLEAEFVRQVDSRTALSIWLVSQSFQEKPRSGERRASRYFSVPSLSVEESKDALHRSSILQ